MVTVVVERTLPHPHTHEDLAAMSKGAAWCLEMYSVKYLHSWLSVDGTRLLCLYEAPDADSVRKTQETANMEYDRVYTVERFPPAGWEKPAPEGA